MGLFNRAAAGHASPAIEITVERGAVAFFSETIGETDPVHRDVDAARAAGHPDVVTPATYPVALGMLAAKEGARRDIPETLAVIGADMRYLLHGTESYDYHGPIFAGDRVEIVNRVTGFSDAKGGELEIAHLEMEIRHATRGLLAVARRDLIHRLPKEKRG